MSSHVECYAVELKTTNEKLHEQWVDPFFNCCGQD